MSLPPRELIFILFSQISILTLTVVSACRDPDNSSLTQSIIIPKALADATASLLPLSFFFLNLSLCRSPVWALRTVLGKWTMTVKSHGRAQAMMACWLAIDTVIHVVSHWLVFGIFGSQQELRVVDILRVGFATGIGWSGHLMLPIILVALTLTFCPHWARQWSLDLPSREAFWMALPLFWSLHQSFRLPVQLSPSSEPTGWTIWPFWMVPTFLFLIEKIVCKWRPVIKVCST